MKPKVFGICSKDSNAMKSANPKSGFYEAETSRTIDTSCQSPCRNQGGMVVIEGNGMRPSHHGDGFKESETMYTLNTIEHHAVAQPSNPYHGNKASYFMNFSDDDAVGEARHVALAVLVILVMPAVEMVKEPLDHIPSGSVLVNPVHEHLSTHRVAHSHPIL